MAEASKCKSCREAILWVRTVAGHVMPLNAVPVEDGTIIILDGIAVVLAGDALEAMMEGPRYVCHFATCPLVKEHRKKK